MPHPTLDLLMLLIPDTSDASSNLSRANDFRSVHFGRAVNELDRIALKLHTGLLYCFFYKSASDVSRLLLKFLSDNSSYSLDHLSEVTQLIHICGV
jgi:hypothetical protein